MSELTELEPRKSTSPAPAQKRSEPQTLTKAQKAAIIIGILGAEAAGPILEQLDESSLRQFARAMSKLRRVEPEVVNATIIEFLTELDRMETMVSGGLKHARELLQDYVAEATLAGILDDVSLASGQNVWKALDKIDDQALAEFLSQEHPQTAAVVLSKLSAEQAAKVLGRVEPEQARDMVFGLTKASSLDPGVIEAIGFSVGEDFLATRRSGGETFKPAERIGTIMNYTRADVRQSVLGFLDETQPELSDAVKSTMFTFQDIHERVERRDMAAIVRSVEQDVLLRALKGAEETAPEVYEFVLSSISSRVAEQLREALGEIEKVKVRESEEAQNAVLKAIRGMEAVGELKLIAIDD